MAAILHASPRPRPAEEAGIHASMLVSTAWLAEHIRDKDLVLICVANSPGFYLEHIPGARLLMQSEITVTRDDIPNELPSLEQLTAAMEKLGITSRSRIVLYGERYNLVAARAYFTLDYLGLAENAALLDGGIDMWRAEGRKQVDEAPQVAPTRLQLKARPEIVAGLDDVRGWLKSSTRPSLLDSRPPEEFSGKRLSEDVPKAGHIPGARNLYWMDLLVSREKPVLRPANELRRLYREAGADGGGAVLTYCRTGMQSSFSYFVARYLGYSARMYDSSFFEWSHEDLPVESSPQ